MDFRAFRPKFLGSKSVPIGPVFFTTFLTPPGGGLDPPSGGGYPPGRGGGVWGGLGGVFGGGIDPPEGGYFFIDSGPPLGGVIFIDFGPPGWGSKTASSKNTMKEGEGLRGNLSRAPHKHSFMGPLL